ncbi:hypothetical protein Riv7116_3451 [Rivularia sp. PCC 7116]|uniref:hypothetical protein n=1 Tax=Rivularia sp. PCC 7116 TaxID=373994 RepID=UPI00029EF476|nr:hypothetical protein [Rivularia sp. PCC 7116]AFY55906.1 hypothetical protein Riv7116_3451 [Rivularia sp. PCC 7116]
MSYQFSFLQAFAGYDFAKSRFFAALNQNTLLKSLQICLRVDFYRQIKIMLFTDSSKHSTHICYKLEFFSQMYLDGAVIEYGTLLERWLYLIENRFKALQNQYSWHFRKHIRESSSDCNRSYIFDNNIAKVLCKYLLRIRLSQEKKNYLLGRKLY